jgi:hypothetical protein
MHSNGVEVRESPAISEGNMSTQVETLKRMNG